VNGPIAQLVALALHGSGYLAGVPSADFLGHNSTSQFCESIRFVRVEKPWFGLAKPTEVPVADSPDAWLAYLKKQSAVNLSVRWQAGDDPKAPDRMLAGFVGGGGTWCLVIRFADGHYERWLARWDIGDKARKDQKIWRVTYGCVQTNNQAPAAAESVANASERLKNALVAIHAFSARQKCDGFTQCFERSLKALAHENGGEAFHRDLFPGSAPSAAADLLAACQHAWVFGGMGSWNDMGFDGADGKEYERVSEQLFQAITTAIPAAVDGYAPTRKA